MSLFLLLIFAAISWLLYHLYLKNLLSQGKPGQIKIALIALGLLFLFMAMSGRAPAVFAIIGAAMTQIMRIAPLLIRFSPFLKKFIGPGGFRPAKQGVSQVVTATLTMTLDQATGKIDGQVTAGDFANRALSSLQLNELLQLYTTCKEKDPEALRLLQTYIARERAEEWEQHGSTDGPGSDAGSGSGHSAGMTSAKMSIDEARQVLGLESELTRSTIIASHRSLMGRFHPDKGGNDYLATKLNTARDVLLNSLTKSA